MLSVTEPFSCGIGGGGFLVLYDASRHKVTTIDGREVAPAAMSPTSFREDGAPLPFNDARYSGLSVGVPGTVATWARLLRKYGTISLREALAPAIRVARKGFVVDQTFYDQTALNRDWFADVPSSAALYLDPDGTPRDVGTVFRNRDLAATLARIARSGPRAFYRGPVAAALIDTVRRPPVSPAATHVWRPGVMTGKDLRAYTVRERAPTQVEPAFLLTPEAAALQERGYVFATTPEIGAATGIELLGGGRVLAAAEPVRRGGGSAMVVAPARRA